MTGDPIIQATPEAEQPEWANALVIRATGHHHFHKDTVVGLFMRDPDGTSWFHNYGHDAYRASDLSDVAVVIDAEPMSLPNELVADGFTLAAVNSERVQQMLRDLRRVAQTNQVTLAVMAARMGIDEEAAEAALSGRLDLTLSDLQEVAIAVGARLYISASPA